MTTGQPLISGYYGEDVFWVTSFFTVFFSSLCISGMLFSRWRYPESRERVANFYSWLVPGLVSFLLLFILPLIVNWIRVGLFLEINSPADVYQAESFWWVAPLLGSLSFGYGFLWWRRRVTSKDP
jgi:hypothetical protein